MAAKFVELKEAAEMLGVSPERLNEMRLRGEIHGLRDGTSWKFKVEEVQRVADDLGSSPAAEADDEPLDFEAPAGTSSDLHLEGEVNDADSPTAIGSMEDFEDLGVAIGSDLDLGGDHPSPGRRDDESSDVALVPDDEGSSVNLVADSGADILAGSDLGFGPTGSDELGFEGSDLRVASDDAIPSQRPPSDRIAERNVADDAELALDDDDELVLEGSGDVTSGTGDTGINLTSPSDSGLNLEDEPLELAGSSVSSLELPEDDEIIDLDSLEPGPEAARRPKADEDFQLAPSSLSAEEDEEDSGSQVIALEDSEAFEDAATMLVEEGEAEPGLGGPQAEVEGALDQYAAPAAQPAAAGVAYGPPQEAGYSIWNVLSLLAIVLVLALAGMLMADVATLTGRDGTFTGATSIMDMMVRMFGLQP